MFAIAGKIIQSDASFTDGRGNQYPAGWAHAASSQERAAVGLQDAVFVDEPPPGADIACCRNESFDGDHTVTTTYVRRPNDQIHPEIVRKIKNFRDDRILTGGYKINIAGADYWLQSDTTSRMQQLGLKDKARDLLAAGGQMSDPIQVLRHPQTWKTLGGTFVPINAQATFDIVTAACNADAGNFAAAEAHIAAVTTVAQPELYDWSTGWVAAYVTPTHLERTDNGEPE